MTAAAAFASVLLNECQETTINDVLEIYNDHIVHFLMVKKTLFGLTHINLKFKNKFRY